MRCEGWLKGEVLHFLSGLEAKGEITDLQPEKSYAQKYRCDIFFRANGQDNWLGMKTFPTNYCRHFSHYKSKPITMFIQDAKDDLQKLKKVEDINGNPIFLMLVYPIPALVLPLPDTPAIKRWNSHIKKFQDQGFDYTVESHVGLDEEKAVDCKIYIFMRGYKMQLSFGDSQNLPSEVNG
jgi:hypothetical protein